MTETLRLEKEWHVYVSVMSFALLFQGVSPVTVTVCYSCTMLQLVTDCDIHETTFQRNGDPNTIILW